MSQRYCPRCGDEVEDTGGFCLLGHSLRLAPATFSMNELRDEVDQAFEEARATVAAVLEPVVTRTSATPPPPPPALSASSQQSPASPPPSSDEEYVARGAFRDVWAGLHEEISVDNDDPIAAFAPPPRMDWGPEKTRRKGSLRRMRTEAG